MLKYLLSSSAFGYYLTTQTQTSFSIQDQSPLSLTRNAICILYPDNNSEVTGVVSFSQDNTESPTKIVATVRGLKPNSLHRFNIHEYGDLTNGCLTTGSIYNPLNKKRGSPLDAERNIGDLGNLKTNEKGDAYYANTDNQVKLFGENTVLGRCVVVHSDEDDFGKGASVEVNTGLACGTIGLCDKFKNLPPSS